VNKIVTYFNRLFALWIILGGVSAYFFPEIFIYMKSYIELFFAITMLGVGMTLDFDSFKDIFKNYSVIIIGSISQFLIMPLFAFLVAKIFSFSKELSLGLILTGSAPGAMASNVLCYLAGADVAYSVSLTTVSTMLAPVLTPALTLLYAHTFLKIPFLSMFYSVLKMVLLPLLFGILIKKRFAKKIEPVEGIFPAISSLFIVFICSVIIALNKTYLEDLNLMIFVAVLVLNVSGIFAGYFVGKLFKFDLLKRRALSIEIGMQNAGLGSVLAIKHFNERVALPAVIFVFVCIFSASLLVSIWSRTKSS